MRAISSHLRTRLGGSIIAAAVPAVALVAVAASFAIGGDPRAAGAPDVTVQLGPNQTGDGIAQGFVGLSLEFPAVLAYTGTGSGAINPVFTQLVRNLAPNQPPVLRIGGDSTDATWWPLRRAAQPRGISYVLTPLWLAHTRALARRLGARLILGVNLESGQPPIAATEARVFLTGIGRPLLQALEIGNEPNRYAAFPWYHTATRHFVLGRRVGYSFGEFAGEFARLRRLLPPVPLAAPTVGAFTWLASLNRFMAAEPTLDVVTFHRYPLNRCFTTKRSALYPSIPNLLSARASRGLAAGLAPYAAVAHRHGKLFRIDEMQSVACAGKLGVSNTFAAALWALDTLFSLAAQGVDGVNVHTFPGAGYQLFTFHRSGARWSASVAPEYYGLVLFAQAAPAGAHLLHVTTRGNPAVRAWATRAVDGQVRVLLINDDMAHTHAVSIAGAWTSGATLTRLIAPSIRATSGVTLGGRSLAPQTGVLGGRAGTAHPAFSSGRYTVALPAASAALLTIPAPR